MNRKKVITNICDEFTFKVNSITDEEKNLRKKKLLKEKNKLIKTVNSGSKLDKIGVINVDVGANIETLVMKARGWTTDELLCITTNGVDETKNFGIDLFKMNHLLHNNYNNSILLQVNDDLPNNIINSIYGVTQQALLLNVTTQARNHSPYSRDRSYSNHLAQYPFEIAEAAGLPPYCVYEITGNDMNKAFLDDFKELFSGAGYTVHLKLFDPYDYGYNIKYSRYMAVCISNSIKLEYNKFSFDNLIRMVYHPISIFAPKKIERRFYVSPEYKVDIDRRGKSFSGNFPNEPLDYYELETGYIGFNMGYCWFILERDTGLYRLPTPEELCVLMGFPHKVGELFTSIFSDTSVYNAAATSPLFGLLDQIYQMLFLPIVKSNDRLQQENIDDIMQEINCSDRYKDYATSVYKEYMCPPKKIYAGEFYQQNKNRLF